MPTGQLGSIAFGTTGITAAIIEYDPPQEEVGNIATPDLSLAFGSNVPYEPEELVEGGEYSVTVVDNNNVSITDTADAGSGTGRYKALRKVQTITVTKPPASGLTNGATRAFSGYVCNVKESQQKTGQRNTITYKIKVAGNVSKGVGS